MTLFTARLAGTQEEMGAQHGALVADEARRLLGFYTTMPERAIAGGEGPIGRLAVKGIATVIQARLGRQRPPELVARSLAFGRAAGMPDEARPARARDDGLAAEHRRARRTHAARAVHAGDDATQIEVVWG